jgi:hypothetical protein
VVVSANIQTGKGKPHIHVDVVLLAPLKSLVIFASGSCDNKELVADIADGVAVASELHLVKGNAVEVLGLIGDDLEALLQAGWLALEVTSSNQEDLVINVLAVRKVMSKVVWDVHLALEHGPRQDVVLVDCLGLFFEDIDSNETSLLLSLLLDQIGLRLSHTCSSA